jgi:phospholipase/lecithinase/hemolysin
MTKQNPRQNNSTRYHPVDVGQDAAARLGFAQAERTIGFAQLSPIAIKEREAEFPQQLSPLKNKEGQSLEDPKKVPELVAATLAHYAKQFQKYAYPITEETLGYAYNPDLETKLGHKDIMPNHSRLQESDHAANIRHWLGVLAD